MGLFSLVILIAFLIISFIIFEPPRSYGPSYQFDPERKKEIKDPELIRLRKKLNEMDKKNEIHK